MNRYRFKTQEEFIRDGQWYDDYDCPVGWAEDGEMNHYLGQDVPEGANESCDAGEEFEDDGWHFEFTNYVLKEEDYTGRYIKALVENPSYTGVTLGEVIKIIGKPGSYILDKTARGVPGMSIPYPLQTSKWELVEEPKDDTKVVPGYVRCVQALMNAKVGTVYPVVDESYCLCENGNTYVWNTSEFTPATKQEYDAQFLDAVNMYDAQQECKRRFPIGCTFKQNGSATKITLRKDDFTYSINGNKIYAHGGGGLLYNNGIYAIAIPEENCDNQDPLYICKQEYRKGMKVKSASKTGIYSGEFIIDVEPSEFRNLSGNTEVVDYSFSNGYLYYKGEYAEILEEGIYDISEIIKTNKPSIDKYLKDSGFAKSNPEAYNWLMKPSIETVHSVDVKLRTKKQINKFKF